MRTARSLLLLCALSLPLPLAAQEADPQPQRPSFVREAAGASLGSLLSTAVLWSYGGYQLHGSYTPLSGETIPLVEAGTVLGSAAGARWVVVRSLEPSTLASDRRSLAGALMGGAVGVYAGYLVASLAEDAYVPPIVAFSLTQGAFTALGRRTGERLFR